LIRVVEILRAGSWSGAADHVTLDYDARHRRRIAITADHGVQCLLDLPQAMLLHHGDGMKLEDGRIVEILARPEPLLAVRAGDAAGLLRLAWHLGNRHLAAQIEPDRILIRRDHVIADMLQRLGAVVDAVEAPFDPEGGAYGGASSAHAHSHDSDHGHGH
jgi:urease accessory protein